MDQNGLPGLAPILRMSLPTIKQYQFRVEQVVTVSAVGLLILSGLIHLWLAPEHFDEAAYLGVLFGLEFVAAGVAAVGISRHRSWGWELGTIVILGAIVTYVVRGTVGLPFVESEGLFEPIGVLAKAVEVLFLVLAAYWWTVIRKRTAP